MKGCPACEGQKIINPAFLMETKKALADLTAELIIFCHENKVDYHQIPALQSVATAIRIIESL